MTSCGVWGGARRSAERLAIALVAALLVAAAGEARIEGVSGTVQIGSGEPPAWRAAQSGDLLYPGDRVRTGSDGRAEVRLNAGTARMYPDSLLRIPASLSGEGSVDLSEGSSIFDIFRRGSGRPFEVRTPEAIVMVKGTRFSVSLLDQSAQVSVFRGLVGVRGLRGAARQEVLLHEGFGALGGAETPFSLGLNAPGPDPWETWSTGGGPPMAPASLLESARSRTSLETVKAVAYEAADARLGTVERSSFSAREGEALVAPTNADGTPADFDGAEEATAFALVDPLADSVPGGLGQQVTQDFAEVSLGAANGSDPQYLVEILGSDVHVVAPGGINQLHSAGELAQIMGGNTTLFGAPLLGILGAQGIAPGDFAELLSQLL